MGIKLSNNAFGTLAASITSSATSITLTTGQGARFPTLAGGDYFYATLVDTSNNLEIVKCTARSTDVLTVVRAQESTTARAYSTGDRIEIRLTAQTFIDATTITSLEPSKVSDQTNTSTGAFDLPSGTTAQRPASPSTGYIRYNTTLEQLEMYDGTQWTSVRSVFAATGGTVTDVSGYRYHTFTTSGTFQVTKGAKEVEYLVVAGGGGGGRYGGGGGAGGYIAATATVSTNSYSVTVGAGGTGWVGDAQSGGNAGNGANSSFSGSTAVGGGGGGNYGNPTGSAGASGGSGGGAGTSNGGATLSGGSGTSGQGNAGGSASGNPGGSHGGGGGGAGVAGAAGSSTGQGGNGLAWLNGTTYAGGGSGSQISTNLTGGTGGGGTGFTAGVSRTSAIDGVANTGGGGGGGRDNSPSAGNGGSGVVIIRYQI